MVWITIWIRNTLQLVKELKSMEVYEDNHTFFCKQQEGESPELAVKLLSDNKIIILLLLYFIKYIVLYR